MQARLSALLVAIGAVAAIAGCDDSTAFRASFNNQEITPTVYAMNGTAVSLPSAISVRAGAVVRVDPSWSFDIAFDLDTAGAVLVHSARAVATELSPVNRVGFQTSTDSFAQITRAPTSGYTYDTTFTLPIGRTLLIDVNDFRGCSGQSFLGINIRAKLVIDSVDLTKRAIYPKLLINRNCGFRSLVPAGELPKD